MFSGWHFHAPEYRPGQGSALRVHAPQTLEAKATVPHEGSVVKARQTIKSLEPGQKQSYKEAAESKVSSPKSAYNARKRTFLYRRGPSSSACLRFQGCKGNGQALVSR